MEKLTTDGRSKNIGIGERICTTCLAVKPLEDFGRQANGAQGRKPWCRPCGNIRAQEYRKGLTDDQKSKRLKTQRSYRAKLNHGEGGVAIVQRIEAGEPCEICDGFTVKMAIDHDHTTGKVRGLLCGNCNSALGLAGESIARLRAMIEYLEAHGDCQDG